MLESALIQTQGHQEREVEEEAVLPEKEAEAAVEPASNAARKDISLENARILLKTAEVEEVAETAMVGVDMIPI